MRCWTHKGCSSIQLFREDAIAQFTDDAKPDLHPNEPLHNYIVTPAVKNIKIELIEGVECDHHLLGDGQFSSVLYKIN